jgi:hypothetical protein
MTNLPKPTNSERQLFDPVTVARSDVLTPRQSGYLPKVNILVVNMDANVLTNAAPLPVADQVPAETDLSSMEIFRAAQRAGSFDFFDDPAEDLYRK